MSFNLSRTQFLQMFAVMQSIKLINGHTATSEAPRLFWGCVNVAEGQFASLTALLSSTPLMPNLEALPKDNVAPILLNPFCDGGYIPHSGPAFVTFHDTGKLNINENAVFGSIEAQFSTAFTNLIRQANARADQIAMPGDAFTSFYVESIPPESDFEQAKLCFKTEDDRVAVIEVLLPRVFYSDERIAHQLIEIMNSFIGQSMIDADIAAGGVTSCDVVKSFAKHSTLSPEKTLEQKLMECPIWATW